MSINSPKDFNNQLKQRINRRTPLLRAIIQWRSSDAINADIKEIAIKDSFDGFLQKFQKRKEFQNLSEQEQQQTMDKVFSFLSRAAAMENNKKPNTSNISGMFSDGKWIQTIINITKPEIKYFFQLLTEKNIKLTSITGMQNGQWIPDLKKLEEFVNFLETKQIPLASITGMQAQQWIPDLKKLEEFVKICREKNLEISSITGMQHWQWIPDLKKLEEFVNFLETKKIPLTSITGMQAWQWIPDLKKLEEFVKICREKNLEISSITGMQAWQWIPDLKKLEEFVKICREKNLEIKAITSKQLWVEESIKLARNK